MRSDWHEEEKMRCCCWKRQGERMRDWGGHCHRWLCMNCYSKYLRAMGCSLKADFRFIATIWTQSYYHCYRGGAKKNPKKPELCFQKSQKTSAVRQLLENLHCMGVFKVKSGGRGVERKAVRGEKAKARCIWCEFSFNLCCLPSCLWLLQTMAR